jgi:hypothetical protein
MKDVVLLGRQDRILEIPAETWRAHLERMRQHPSERLAFMTPEHHRVRNLAVSELPRNGGRPLAPEYISHQLQLPLDTVKTVLDDLQKHLFFLTLDRAGDVEWAFPVTVEKTPHHLRFSTGEDIYAA